MSQTIGKDIKLFVITLNKLEGISAQNRDLISS